MTILVGGLVASRLREILRTFYHLMNGGPYPVYLDSVFHFACVPTVLRNYKDIIVWIKLDKSYFNLSDDIIIGNVYLYPQGSTCIEEDQFAVLLSEISSLPYQGPIILCGDFNSRTGSLCDYIKDYTTGCDGDLSPLLDIDATEGSRVNSYLMRNNMQSRSSMDGITTNKHGLELIDLCKTCNMFIMNGRCGADQGVGKYTRVDPSGFSVIDYVLCNVEAHPYITNFQVADKFPESDHIPLILSLNLTYRAPVTSLPSENTWTPIYKFVWHHSHLEIIKHTLTDHMSISYWNDFRNSIIDRRDVDCVATAYTDYFSQACYRACGIKRVKPRQRPGPGWFDAECRAVRTQAVRAGSAVITANDRDKHIDLCRRYRALKQRKKRAFISKRTVEIEAAFLSNKTQLWRLLSKYTNTNATDEPSGESFVNYYSKLAKEPMAENFDMDNENEIKEFLLAYDNKFISEPVSNKTEYEVLNCNVTTDEIENAIDALKNNKAVGGDMIPAEFLKHNKNIVIEDICLMLNYIIEMEAFPDSWAEGIRTSIYKAGERSDPNNFRGITVLPIFEKIFEIIVQRRLEFIDDCFLHKDKYNGGFLKDSQTIDNLFILQSLIERQLLLGQNLIICFIDFSRAFDLMSRHILFYKLIKSGLHGRVINTLRSLYNKTCFRVKHGGYASESIHQVVGVNQGGNASPIIFRKYMSDMRDYLDENTGVVLSHDEILLHLLWADDLILTSTSIRDAQSQLDGLSKFCSKNKSIVNAIKSKCMIFGQMESAELYFNGDALERVNEYKYVGNIVRSVTRAHCDVFAANYEYLYDKAKRSIFSMKKKTKTMGPLSPKISVYLFDSLIRPVITYGGAIWGSRLTGRKLMDKLHLWFLKMTLGVKTSTSNIITLGECGSLPPSVTIQSSCLIYFYRVRSLPENSIIKKAFCEMKRLHDLGFSTWYGRILEIANCYGINLDIQISKEEVKSILQNHFVRSWKENLCDLQANPILRTYNRIKSQFELEPYLYLVKNRKYRHALAKLRTSSHNLEIERGRHTRPVTPADLRICTVCNVVEDEEHLLLHCVKYAEERNVLFSKIVIAFPDFNNLSSNDKLVFLISSQDPYILTLVGKFVYSCFQQRNGHAWYLRLLLCFTNFTCFYEEDASHTIPEVFRMQLEYCGSHLSGRWWRF